MNKKAILENINKLKNNAMFAMSLTSKELFHSNIWAWMLRKYPKIFTPVFYPKYSGISEVEVFREKYHFDLLIKINGEFIIIENKFKSIPDKEQLNKYYEKFKNENAKIVLVSYFQPFFTSTLFDFEEYISYDTLYNRLNQVLTNCDSSAFADDDFTIIKNYIDFLNLLNQLQNNIVLNKNDKIEDLWNILKDYETQSELDKINFTKTFERLYTTKLTQEVLKGFSHVEAIDEIRIDCGRDLKIFSDFLFYFPGAWNKDESKRQDLCYLAVSLWGNEYRYYAGLHKKQCGITAPKQGRADRENKLVGFKYLSKNYNWLFGQETEGVWNGYSYESEMYLYKKIDISQYTISELQEKVQLDLALIHNYIKNFVDEN